MTTLIVWHRVIESAYPDRIAGWLNETRALWQAHDAVLAGNAGTLMLATLPDDNASTFIVELQNAVESAEKRGIRAVFALCAAQDGSLAEALREGESLVCGTTYAGVRYGNSLHLSTMSGLLSIDDSLLPASDTDRAPALDVPANTLTAALLNEDWSRAQDWIESAVEHGTDPRAYERLSGLLELARGRPKIAAQLLRHAAVGATLDEDPRAALCHSLAALCEGDLVASARASITALAAARDKKDDRAADAAERMLRLAFDASH